MKGFKPFPSVGLALALCAVMTACGGSTPRSGPPALIITSSMLPNGVQGIAYNQPLTVTGGQSPYTWTVDSGSLPAGLSMTGAGLITGVVTPTAKTTSFTVKVVDSQTPVAAIAKQGLSLTINPPLGIGTTSLPQGTSNLPYPATTLMATGGLAPFTWTLAPGSSPLPTGLTLTSSGVIGGTPTQTGTFNITVQANDADSETATAPLTLTIAGLLQGSNTFYLNGFNNNLPFYLAGSFVADGSGNITSGVLDENGTDAVGLLNGTFTGTFSVFPNSFGNAMNNGSLGTMNLTITPSGGGTPFNRTYGLAFSQDGNTHIIDNDPNDWGSGLIQTQSLAGLTGPSSLNGSYAYGLQGIDSAGARYAGAGAFTSSNPPTNGMEDINDNGTVQTNNTSVSFLTLDTTTGRGTMQISVNGVPRSYAFYVANAQGAGLVAVQTDPVSSGETALALIVPQVGGSIGGGNANFGNASLNSAVVMQLHAIHSGSSDESLGVATFDGKGNLTRADGAPGYYLDENQAGTLASQNCTSGTYSVATNGRVTWTQTPGTCTGAAVPPSVWYLSNNNRGFVIGQDTGVTAGVFEVQSGGPFTNNSIIDPNNAPANMLGGTVTPLEANQTNEVQSVVAYFNGVWGYSYLQNGPAGNVPTPGNLNLGWLLDTTKAGNTTLGAALGRYTMGVSLSNTNYNVLISYAIEGIPAGNTTQTAEKWVLFDALIPNNNSTPPVVQPHPRMIYFEH